MMSMPKSLLALIAILTGLTLAAAALLPPHTPSEKSAYSLVQSTLKAPLPATSLQLTSQTLADSQFAVQLGLYPDLQQATTTAQQLSLPSVPSIFATEQNAHLWYTLLLGPYPDMEQAQSAQSQLATKGIAATNLVVWPADGASSKQSASSKSQASPNTQEQGS